MTYVKTYLPTLKMHVVNLKRDVKDLSRDVYWLEVCGKLRLKTLYFQPLQYGVKFPTHTSSTVIQMYLSVYSIQVVFITL